MDLSGRTILVTGASSGIGRTTAILLGRLGARVVLSGRREDALEKTLSSMTGSGHVIETFDLAEPEGLAAWMKELSRRSSPFSGLAHCAGVQSLKPLKLLRSGQAEEALRVNVTASLMLAKSFSQRGVHDSGGSIVFVSSVMGAVGSAGRAVYCASKGALDSLARALALELAGEGIRVNCVAPGFVRTGALQQAETLVGTEKMKAVEEMHPLGFGDPEDVANAIAFLLAGTGRWITGSVLYVDGGYTAH
jgi:NAD(P)-dependent dehydrogenase (short-subunit alcohol dehydrogenase family)